MPISQIVTNSIADGNVTIAKFSSLAQVIKPVITSPANNATGILDAQLFTASPYLSLYGRSQANAQWQISTSPTFAFINVNSTITGSNTQFQANSSSGLITNTIHYVRVRYSDDANNSSEYSNTVQFTTNTSFAFVVSYLVVAGGGGGGGNGPGGNVSDGGGGGGAGGLLSGNLSVTAGNTYSVTIGSGGNGVVSGVSLPTSGTNTSGLGFTAIGGGYGGSRSEPAPYYNGAPGGSGGGGAGDASPVGTGGSGTPGQGNPGGNGIYSGPGWGSGGGGGAGASGGTATAPRGGDGGVGIQWINGSFYAGGGGGGDESGATGPVPAGGSGGGGAGGRAGVGTAGTVNTGGGGGGGDGNSGGNGGSGVVIVRYPNGRTISNPGGGLTLSSSPSGSNTFTTITAGTGNISWS